jgi:hypothetical protein
MRVPEGCAFLCEVPLKGCASGYQAPQEHAGARRLEDPPLPQRPYRRPMPRFLWWTQGGGKACCNAVQGYLAHMKTPTPRTLP